MSDASAVITRFYEAFANRDADAMAACYADDVVFSDPVFVQLEGERARNMWRMLCGRSKDLAVAFQLGADGLSAQWQARYTFGATGRPVHNLVQARFVVERGRIRQHTDVFAFWRWSRQALGVPGVLLGWTPLLRRSVRQKAMKSLDAFEARRHAEQSAVRPYSGDQVS